MNIDIFRLFRKQQVAQKPAMTAAEQQLSEKLQRLTLRRLFQRPEFSVQDGLNEYDHDYTHFTALKDLLTREMQRAMARHNVASAGNDVAQGADDQEAAVGSHDRSHDRSSASRT